MKKEIITIAGKLGSGKSSTANRLAEILGFRRASTGDFMRAMAVNRGISLGELGEVAQTDPSIDKELDDYTRNVGDDTKVILDSRLGFHFIPDSFKVFLELNPGIAAKRILSDIKNNPSRHMESAEAFDSPESITKAIALRVESERIRYRDLYGIENHMGHENFDLVIDTGSPEYENNIGKVADEIAEGYKNWLQK